MELPSGLAEALGNWMPVTTMRHSWWTMSSRRARSIVDAEIAPSEMRALWSRAPGAVPRQSGQGVPPRAMQMAATCVSCAERANPFPLKSWFVTALCPSGNANASWVARTFPEESMAMRMPLPVMPRS